MRLLFTVLVLFKFIYCPAQNFPSLPPNQLVLPEKDQQIKFIWQGDTMAGKWNPHAAILIPVKLKGNRKQFYMQFDLGSPYTVLYKSKMFTGDTLNDFVFTAHKTKIVAKKITVIDNKTEAIIGTIGADLIENKIVMINYPGQYISISNNNSAIANLPLQDFMFARRSVLLPAVINGKKLMLYFDTGSSAFELLVSKETSLAMAAPGTEPVKYPVRSWNKTMIANTVATNDSINIGVKTIPIVATTYMENVSETMISQMMKMGIGGMTGNKLFLDYTLVLDAKNKKFGVISR